MNEITRHEHITWWFNCKLFVIRNFPTFWFAQIEHRQLSFISNSKNEWVEKIKCKRNVERELGPKWNQFISFFLFIANVQLRFLLFIFCWIECKTCTHSLSIWGTHSDWSITKYLHSRDGWIFFYLLCVIIMKIDSPP